MVAAFCNLSLSCVLVVALLIKLLLYLEEHALRRQLGESWRRTSQRWRTMAAKGDGIDGALPPGLALAWCLEHRRAWARLFHRAARGPRGLQRGGPRAVRLTREEDPRGTRVCFRLWFRRF